MDITGVSGIGAYRAVTTTMENGSQKALFFRREATPGATATPLTSYTPPISPQTTGALLAAQEQASDSAHRFYTRAALATSQPAPTTPTAPTITAPVSADTEPESSTVTYARRSDTDPYSYRSDATESDVAQASSIRSGLVFSNAEWGMRQAPQVDQATAGTLKKVAGVYDPDQTAASGGSVNGLIDRGPALSTTTFNFALRGDTANFALQGEGDLGGLSLLDALKNGALQIDVEKWGGVGNAGLNAGKLSLSGAAYNVATFNDGDTGTTNIRHNQTDLGSNTIGATFGGWSARDGLTFTVRSYDPNVNVSNLRLLIP